MTKHSRVVRLSTNNNEICSHTLPICPVVVPANTSECVKNPKMPSLTMIPEYAISPL